jgi:2-dehydro-3-deoxyphosphooctonate aldolase (KDO 8-P synthase)
MNPALPAFGAGSPLVLIAGPCVIESEAHCLFMAEKVAAVAANVGLPMVFKASFDKANRTSIASFRGPGLEEGLRVLKLVRARTGLPVTTDVHAPEQAAAVADVVDLLQVPAFLCRQTDLLLAVARTGRPVSVKKGQFLAPGAMRHIVEKLRSGGASRILLLERGSSFGHGDLVVDFRGLAVLRATGAAVGFDATHACQEPSTGEVVTGGCRTCVAPLARAAVAVGVDALFVEVHDHPEDAPSDSQNMLSLSELEPLLRSVVAIRSALGA